MICCLAAGEVRTPLLDEAHNLMVRARNLFSRYSLSLSRLSLSSLLSVSSLSPPYDFYKTLLEVRTTKGS